MTQPRKPSGPGEWAVGDWVEHPAVGVVRYEAHPTAVYPGSWRWLARPVENDPEGWVAHDGGPNPAPGMRVDAATELGSRVVNCPSEDVSWDRINCWRPSTEPAPEAGAVNTSPEPVSKSPENEQVDGLEVVDVPARLRTMAEGIRAIHRNAYGSELVCDTLNNALEYGRAQGAEIAADSIRDTLVTRASAATALEAANRRIAELSSDKAVLTGQLFASRQMVDENSDRALKAEARLAEAEKVMTEIDAEARTAAAMHDAGYVTSAFKLATSIYGKTDAFLQQGVKP